MFGYMFATLMFSTALALQDYQNGNKFMAFLMACVAMYTVIDFIFLIANAA